MNKIEKLSGTVLAGGKSSRLGTDKALLKFNSHTLLQHAISLIEPYCSVVRISGDNSEYEVFGRSLVSDKYPGCGPIGGIYSSLVAAETDWNLFVSVDVPYINSSLLTKLLENLSDDDCVVPKHELGVEPLIALYSRKAIPLIEHLIKNGEYKVSNLLSELNTKFVDCNDLVRQYPNLFFNLNRMEDYQIVLTNNSI
jgi:molybdopterin-guanine dinucleotide biosynthesis protein A